MAARIVRYGKEQIYFRCPSGQADEALPSHLRSSFILNRDHRNLFRPLDFPRTVGRFGETETSHVDQTSAESLHFSESKESMTFEHFLTTEETRSILAAENTRLSLSDENSEVRPRTAREESPLNTIEIEGESTLNDAFETNRRLSHSERSDHFNEVMTNRVRLDSWYRLVDDFARRRLTYETDRLPSIAGVATEVQTLLGYRYLCGLWLEDIHWGLLWRGRGRATTPKDFIAPSWSWAFITVTPHEINDEYNPYESHHFPIYDREAQERLSPKTLGATVLRVDAKNVVDNSFLQVISGILTLHNYSRPLSSLLREAYDFDETFVLKFDARETANVESKRRILLDFDSMENREKPPFDAEQGVILLVIAQWAIKRSPEYYRIPEQSEWVETMSYALILEPTRNKNKYRRIGIVEFPEGKFVLEEWVLQTITII